MFGLKNQYFLKYGYSLYYVRTIPQLERIVTDYQHVRTLSKFMVELSVCLDVFVVCLDWSIPKSGKMCVCVYIWTCLETSSSMTIYIYMYTLVLCDQDGNSPPRDVWNIDSISHPNWGSFAMSDLIISKVLNHFERWHITHVPSSIEQCSTPHIVPFYLLIENGITILDCDHRHQNIGCITPLTNLQTMIYHREITHHAAGIDI